MWPNLYFIFFLSNIYLFIYLFIINWRLITLQYRSGFIDTFPCFPDDSVGKESACSAGDPGLIPASGRFTGEGIGYPLQYS